MRDWPLSSHSHAAPTFRVTFLSESVFNNSLFHYSSLPLAPPSFVKGFPVSDSDRSSTGDKTRRRKPHKLSQSHCVHRFLPKPDGFSPPVFTLQPPGMPRAGFALQLRAALTASWLDEGKRDFIVSKLLLYFVSRPPF